MNLSDLIVATPETPKGKTGLGDKAADQTQHPDGAGFLELTIGTPDAAPEEVVLAPDAADQSATKVSTLVARVLETELGGIEALPIVQTEGAPETEGNPEQVTPDEPSLTQPTDPLSPALLSVSDKAKPAAPDAGVAAPVIAEGTSKSISPTDTGQVLAAKSAPAAEGNLRVEVAKAPPPAQPIPDPEASSITPRLVPAPAAAAAAAAAAADQVSTPAAQQVQTILQSSQVQQSTAAIVTAPRIPGSENLTTELSRSTSYEASSARPVANLETGSADTAIRATQNATTSTDQVSQALQTPTNSQADLRAAQGFYNQGAVQASSGGEAPVLVSQQQTSSVSTPPTSSPVSGALSSELSAQAAQRTVLPQIVGSVQNLPGTGVIDLMLDPPELGRIEIVLELTDKSLRATLTADRNATGEMIRRQADELLQQFSDAGFDDVDLQFSDRRDGRGDEADQDLVAGQGPVNRNDVVTAPQRYAAIQVDGRIDMRL